jgi:hypothetical protein
LALASYLSKVDGFQMICETAMGDEGRESFNAWAVDYYKANDYSQLHPFPRASPHAKLYLLVTIGVP